MRKASINLQDLRRKIYLKAKSEEAWWFWGLYVRVCKEEEGIEAFLEQIQRELRAYLHLPYSLFMAYDRNLIFGLRRFKMQPCRNQAAQR